MIKRHVAPFAVPPDAPTAPPRDPGDEPDSPGKRFPWLTIWLLLVIVVMSVRNVFVESAKATYKKGFEELRKTCADQNQLLKEQNEAIEAAAKDRQKQADEIRVDGARVAISAYNLGYAHYPPEQFLGVLTNQLGITNVVVQFLTNFEGDENMTNISTSINRREL